MPAHKIATKQSKYSYGLRHECNSVRIIRWIETKFRWTERHKQNPAESKCSNSQIKHLIHHIIVVWRLSNDGIIFFCKIDKRNLESHSTLQKLYALTEQRRKAIHTNAVHIVVRSREREKSVQKPKKTHTHISRVCKNEQNRGKYSEAEMSKIITQVIHDKNNSKAKQNMWTRFLTPSLTHSCARHRLRWFERAREHTTYTRTQKQS